MNNLSYSMLLSSNTIHLDTEYDYYIVSKGSEDRSYISCVLLEEKKEHYRLFYKQQDFVKKTLTPMQEKAVQTVIKGDAKPYLLFGVTGSGKTEVYMEMIDYYLNQGKTSIVLVPEISLTPQMINRFQVRFGNKIAAIHSALSDGEKYDEWRRICRGEASIVIGARSAIFAPLENIGIIIVDEEHSESYKQTDPSPRYNAKDIAIQRSKYHHCSVVFGSATPSLEAMARAQKNVFTYLELPERVNGRSLPTVEVVDMNQAMRKATGHFSEKLKQEIIAAAAEQSIDQLPDLNDEAAITALLKSTDSVSGTVAAGSYMLKAVCVEKATGTVQIEVVPVP